MKQCITLIVLVLLSIPGMGQQKTLVSGDIDHGGYGGPELKLTALNGESELLVGGRGGWIIDHTFVIGGGGYGLTTEIPMSDSTLLNFGYGGLDLEFIVKSDELIHFTVGTLIGAGGTGLRNRILDENFTEEFETDPFFVLEPRITAELNVTDFFRIGIGVSYRYISGVDKFNLSESELSGISGIFVCKFGAF